MSGGSSNSSQSARTGAWFDGKRIELLLIEREPGANTIKVVDQIKAMMPQLEASIPRSVHVDLVSDRSTNIRDSVSDVEMTLMITIGLVVLTIFVFLRKIWATIIPSVTVPLALVATAGVMYVVGFNLDNISLMALTIAVGFVVDDAIVMIENIVRYIEEGEAPFDAAIKGAGQIGFTIVSITFSLIAVFIPLLFMGGIIGRLFREFAVTVSVAVVASAFVSLTLTPMMCSRFLTHEDKSKQPGRLNRMAEGFFNAMLRGYDRGLVWVFRHQPLMLAATLGLIVLTGYLYIAIPKGFIPQQDTGFIFGALQARQDASFASVAKIGKRGLRGDPEGSGGIRRGRVCRRHRLQSEREHGSDVHPAQAVQRTCRRAGGDRPAEAADRQAAGREVLHAGRSGRDRRRAAGAGAIPIHADRQRRGGIEPLGADPAAADGQDACADRRRVGPADRARRTFRSRSIAMRRTGWDCRWD